jgi:hypothetical protein
LKHSTVRFTDDVKSDPAETAEANGKQDEPKVESSSNFAEVEVSKEEEENEPVPRTSFSETRLPQAPKKVLYSNKVLVFSKKAE